MTEYRTLLSNFVKKSQTNGLLKNDGTVDTTNYLSTHQDITGKEDKSNKVTSISASSTDTQYPSAKLLYDTTNQLENSIVDMIYPIGSIYMSVNSTSPQTLFGGTWEQIKDTFLLATGDVYENGSTGGEATHTLTTNEMPSHTHTQNAHTHTTTRHYVGIDSDCDWAYASTRQAASSGSTYFPYSDKNTNGITEPNTMSSVTATNQNTGGGQSHNNMPPYLTVYMWKRTG